VIKLAWVQLSFQNTTDTWEQATMSRGNYPNN